MESSRPNSCVLFRVGEPPRLSRPARARAARDLIALVERTLRACLLATLAVLSSSAQPRVTTPPDSFFEFVSEADRAPARTFYSKYLDILGMPVVASPEVADQALKRTHWIVTHLLAGRPDIVEAMRKDRMYLIVIGKDQLYCDIPEYSHQRNPAYWNERVRGTGGRPTSFGEENLLSLPLDRYDDESIGVHEFCHTIDRALRSIDPTWTDRRNATYRHALDHGLWKNTYAAGDPGEFWAEICQSYFDCNRVNNWNHGPIGTREQLKQYDPESYDLVHTTFKLSPENDWHYTWVQKLPNVTAPPAKFHIDPYYTKFTWAREFPVIGRDASNESLLKANETIRKVFAYRHDILKTLINDGWKLAVVALHEKLPADQTKLLTVREDNPADTVRVFGKAFYDITATRPIDPDWDKRRDVQQYELRVQRLDIRFDEKLKEIHDKDRADYWAAGLAAYFDAGIPPMKTREQLKKLDPGLFALVHGTLAYESHPDWRYSR